MDRIIEDLCLDQMRHTYFYRSRLSEINQQVVRATFYLKPSNPDITKPEDFYNNSIGSYCEKCLEFKLPPGLKTVRNLGTVYDRNYGTLITTHYIILMYIVNYQAQS